MNFRKYLIALVGVGVAAAAVAIGPSVAAGPAAGPPQPVSGERIELGTRAITGDATKAVDCPGRNTAGSTVREAGVKETRTPEEVAASMMKVLAVPAQADRGVMFQVLLGGVEVERHVVASIDGKRVAVVVLTDTGDGLGVDFAIACVSE